MNTATSVLFGTTKQGGVLSTSKAQSSVKTTVYVSDRARLVNQYTQFAVKTAQSTVEMCRVVFEAKEELKDEEFELFCRDIGHSKKDPTIRKYLAIGAQYERLIQYAELLPNAWTSIYQITLLPADVFDALVATESSMANLTGAQIKKLMGKESDDKSKTTNDSESHKAVVSASAEATADTVSGTAPSFSAMPLTKPQIYSSSEQHSVAAEAVDVAPASSVPASDVSLSEKPQLSIAMHSRSVPTATTTVDVDAAEEFEPYEVTIRFQTEPSAQAKSELADCFYKIKSKYGLDFEVVNKYAHEE